VRPSAMRPLWHPPGHRPGRAPRWPQALPRSPVPAATSLGHEPVLSAEPGITIEVTYISPSIVSGTGRPGPARLAVRPHESVGMLIGRHRRYTGYGARGGPPDDPIQPPSPGTTKSNGNGRGDRTSMRNWQALVFGHSLAWES
jgi:hypothetical protein